MRVSTVMDLEKKRLSPWPFIFAGIIVLAGVGAGAYVFISGLAGLSRDMIRIQAPGAYDLELDRPGTYTIFLETRGVSDGTVVAPRRTAAGLTVRVTDPQGEPVAVDAPASKSTYSFGGRQGESLMVFSAPTAGRYHLDASWPGKKTPAPLTLTVSCGFGKRLVVAILGGIGLFIIGLGTGVVVVVLTLVFHHTDRKESVGYDTGTR